MPTVFWWTHVLMEEKGFKFFYDKGVTMLRGFHISFLKLTVLEEFEPGRAQAIKY